MLIVDAQVHIWRVGLPTNTDHRQIHGYSVEDLLNEMNDGGIDAAVIHPPGWDPNAPQWASEAAAQHPDRLSVLGKLPLEDPASRSLVKDWKKQPGMLGLRFTFQEPHQQTWLTDGTMDWLWPAVEEARLPVALLAANVMRDVAIVAERHPRVQLIVDHMGIPRFGKDAEGFANLPQLLALARFPNVAVKATGAPSYSTDPYPYRNIHDYLHQIYDAFGPRRMFWGTDITRMPCTWRECVTLFTEELPWLSDGDKELIMGRALCEFIDWKLPGL